jgi:hypothetical protein
VALAAWSLISEEEFRERYTAGGVQQIGNIQSAIQAATLAIEKRIDRLLVSRGSITEYHSLAYRARMEELFVGEWPILSVTSLHEDDTTPRTYGASSLLVSGTDYETVYPDRLRRLDAGGGPVYWGTGARVVRLVYTAGYATTATVPDDLKQVAFYVAASMFTENTRKQWGVSGASDATGSWQRFTGYFTPAMDEMLSPYKRREFSRTWERVA